MYKGQYKILEVLKNNGWQQKLPHLERNVGNWAALGGHMGSRQVW
jgi:hypothetical protein